MSKLEHLVVIVKRDMDNAKIPYNREIPIVVNNRLRTVAGKCFYRYKDGIKYPTRIEINGKMLRNETDDFLKDTICHELLHSAKECVNCGHTGMWKRYASLMNIRNKNYHITRCYESSQCSRSYRSAYKYKITCKDCGKTYYYRRKADVIKAIMNGKKWYTCGRCNSDNLMVEVL